MNARPMRPLPSVNVGPWPRTFVCFSMTSAAARAHSCRAQVSFQPRRSSSLEAALAGSATMLRRAHSSSTSRPASFSAGLYTSLYVRETIGP